MRLRESDFRRILAFLREADDVDGSEPFPVQLLESLTRLIPADVSHFCELDFQPRRIISDTYSDGRTYEFDRDEDLSEAWYIVDRLPTCLLRHRTGRPDALKNSDFMTARELRSSELWELRFRPFGHLDELSTTISRSRRYHEDIPLPRGPRVRRARPARARPAPPTPPRALPPRR